MLVKRPIYNQQLQCVAFEILSHHEFQANDATIAKLFELISHTDTQLPLIIPFALGVFLEQASPPINNPIILKLAANEIEKKHSLKELQDSLFSIALLIDDPQQLAWLNFAEYIGLTDHLMTGSDVTKVVSYSKAKQRKVIAYNINKASSFDKCKAMTMDYYCGDFIFNPSDDDQTEIAANKLNLLFLIDTLQQENCDFNEITNVIQTDPLLSFQLLKVANSVAFSGGGSIDSIEQAITRLGLLHLKNWVLFLSMKNISNKPIEILESGLIRAYMAEQIAKGSKGSITSQSAYTAGLLSILDCLLNKPMTELVKQITLAEEIKVALITRSGPLGELLALVIAYEKGDWAEIADPNFNGLDLSKLYIDSLAMASKGTKAMSGH